MAVLVMIPGVGQAAIQRFPDAHAVSRGDHCAVDPGQTNIAQCDGLSGELRADSAAEKLAAMEEPDLGHVARIVAQHHTLADIRREGGVDVAHALKTHTIRMDFAGFGDRQKQQIELLQGFCHAGNKSALLPALLGRNLGFPVRARVVLAQEFTKAAVEFGEGQRGFADNTTLTDVPRQIAKEHLVDGLEEAFDPAAPARMSRRGKDETQLDVGGNLLEMDRGKIAAVVCVEYFRNPEDDPLFVSFPPDRLTQVSDVKKRTGC